MSKKKVNFSLSSEIVGEATTGVLIGEFNDWNVNSGAALKKAKDGSLTTSISLEAGKSYEYRYLLNDGRWVNDDNAKAYSFKPNYQIDNCVIAVPGAAPKKAKVAKKVVAKAGKDNLTKIEGIGKKIAEHLAADGIDTFAALAKATQKTLKGILKAAGPRYNIHDPKTWAKQAKLATAGKWEELKKLQAELDGGK